MDKCGIRPMSPDDLEGVAALEERSFSLPWTLGMLRESLAQSATAVAYVLEDQDGIAAYLLARQVLPEAELLRIAVAADKRRKGYAGQLMRRWLSEAEEAGCRDFYLEIRQSNEAAKALYASFSFESAGIRKAYYADNGEDAEIWSLHLEGNPL